MSDVTASESALIEHIRRNSGLTVTAGMVMLVAGLLALAAPAVAGLSITIMVGATLAISGVSQCFLAFKVGAFGRALVIFSVGIFMAVTGFYMMTQPVTGLASLTLLLMGYLIISGILEIGVALQLRPAKGWGLEMTNGVITLLLGILLWRQFPLSGAWAVGVLFGIKMFVSGLALVAIGRAVNQAAASSPG